MTLNLEQRDGYSYKRIATPENVAPNSYQKLDMGPEIRITKTRAGPRESTVDEQNPLSQKVQEKAPFNVKSIRKDPAAGQEGFVVFNPGPGSYTTRMSSIKTNFVPRDTHGQTVLSSISKQEPGFYFTRDKGGLTKHI